jgi:hypothetical protein
MNLSQRLRRLETELTSNPIVLCFADGGTRDIPSTPGGVLNLFSAALSGEIPCNNTKEQLDWIRDSVGYIFPGGGHMIEVIRGALNAPKDLVHRSPVRVRPPQFGRIPSRSGANPGGLD